MDFCWDWASVVVATKNVRPSGEISGCMASSENPSLETRERDAGV